jgi:hypothetical protein
MKTNPDAKRGPSIRLTEDLLKGLGLTCIWLDGIAGQEGQTRLALRSIVGRRAKGEKIWFRNEREADRVQREILSRCFEAVRNRDGLSIKLPFDQVVELVFKTARALGITPIPDCDVATTFDSIHRRIEAAIARMQRDGSMKRINREYSELRQATGKPDRGAFGSDRYIPTGTGTSAGTKPGTSGTSLPSYSEWLIGRLGRELSNCTDLVHITRL